MIRRSAIYGAAPRADPGKGESADPLDDPNRPPRTLASRRTLAVLVVLWSSLSAPIFGQSFVPAGEIELARLIDVVAEQLDVNIEYDKDTVRGSITIRRSAPMTESEMWLELNRLLAAKGVITIQTPASDSMTVVRLEQASSLSRVWWDTEELESNALLPGFVTLVYRPRHRGGEVLSRALDPFLSRPGGKTQIVDDDHMLLISDLSWRVDEMLTALAELDSDRQDIGLREVALAHLSADRVAELGESLLKAETELSGRESRYRFVPSADQRSLVVIAPLDRLDSLEELITGLDRAESRYTEIYVSTSFPIDDIAALIESVLSAAPGAAALDPFTIVRDVLTNSLVITATQSEHTQIEALLARVESAPPEARSTVQTFMIRNRPVDEILGVLQELIQAGVLESAPGDEDQRIETSLQTTRRELIAPDPAADPTDGVSPPAPARARSVANDVITLTADPGTNRILAVGDPRVLERIGSLIEQIDVRQPQVMLEVLIVSLTDDQTLDLGVELERLSIVMGGTSFSLSSFFGLSGNDDGSIGRGQGFTGALFNPGEFSVVVRALETVTGGRSMSRPRLLVGNNQQATLNSVLQAPFASTNASTTVATTSFGGTQDAGTTITIRPQIAEGDHLVLEYSVALSTFVGESSSPELPPPRQQNQIQSIVTIPDGFTVAVGGLEFTTEGEAVSQIPLLGDIPGIGELFKSRSKSKTTSHFYVFIRPNILRRADFADLRWVSAPDLAHAGIPDDWPKVEPRIIR